jgi:hypothetical protein
MSLQSQVPSFAWARALSGRVTPHSVVADTAGYVYCTGVFSDTVDFDAGPGVYNLIADPYSQTGFVLKYSSAGTFIWAKKIQGNTYVMPHSMVGDASGNLCITGRFYGTADFDPGPNSYSLASTGAADVFIMKLRNDGSFAWAGVIGCTDEDFVNAIAADANGNLFIGGSFGYYYSGISIDLDPKITAANFTHVGHADAFMVKLDSSGNYLSGATWGSTAYEYISDIAIDAAGSVFVSCLGSQGLDLDPGTATYTLGANVGMSAAYLMKLTNNVQFIWAKHWGSASDQHHIAFDSNHNIYLSGGFYSSTDLDPGPGIDSAHACSATKGWLDGYLIKLDQAGQYQWSRTWIDTGYIYPGNLYIDIYNNLYVTGFIDQFPRDMDPGPGIDTARGPGAYYLKFDSNGQYIWRYVVPNQSVLIYSTMAFGKNGDLFFGCPTGGSPDLDPGPGTCTFVSNNGWNSALIKFTSPAPVTTALDDLHTILPEIYPNPSDGHFTISAALPFHYSLYAITGEKIATLTAVSARCDYSLDLNEGLYLLKDEATGGYGRLIIRK